MINGVFEIPDDSFALLQMELPRFMLHPGEEADGCGDIRTCARLAVLQAAQHGAEEIDVRSGEKGRLWLITRKNILVVRRHWRFYCGTVNEAEALQQVCDVLVLVQLDGTGLPVALNCHAEDPPGSSKVLDGEACSQVLLQLPDEVLVVVGQHDVVDVQSYNDVSGSIRTDRSRHMDQPEI